MLAAALFRRVVRLEELAGADPPVYMRVLYDIILISEVFLEYEVAVHT